MSLEDKGLSQTSFAMQVSRNTTEKEKQAELVKHEVRIIWGDFMKGCSLRKASWSSRASTQYHDSWVCLQTGLT